MFDGIEQEAQQMTWITLRIYVCNKLRDFTPWASAMRLNTHFKNVVIN